MAESIVNRCKHGIIMGEPWNGAARVVACTCETDNANFKIGDREFRVKRETVHGARGFSLREWDSNYAGGREILHDYGIQSAASARRTAADIVAHTPKQKGGN